MKKHEKLKKTEFCDYFSSILGEENVSPITDVIAEKSDTVASKKNDLVRCPNAHCPVKFVRKEFINPSKPECFFCADRCHITNSGIFFSTEEPFED